MRSIFTAETLKHSAKPILMVLLVCALVWFWGRYRKVDVDLVFRTAIHGEAIPRQLEVSIYNVDQRHVASLSKTMVPSVLPEHRLSPPPGEYTLRGVVVTDDGARHSVEQRIVIPEDDASIELVLREK